MRLSSTWIAIPAFTFALAAAACGGGEGDDDNSAGPCVNDKSLCAELHLPADFTGKPVKIIAGFYPSQVPATGPSGPPAGVAAIMENPVISKDMPLAMDAEEIMTKGDYYVYVVLYNEGGGNFVPVKNIDYVAQSSSKVHVGDGPVNLGDLTFSLYK